ncbi:hypothetical protein [Kitasatospora purpeofusca]|uniref:hypothetical protein n=1 Tax=Kitasatospora purpeofusca TaxID=67352 RepID=UPI003816B782
MRFSLRRSTEPSATAPAALLTPAGPANADTALLTCRESTMVVELIGSITAGTFQGAVVNATATALNSRLDACSTTRVSELDHTGALAVLGL